MMQDAQVGLEFVRDQYLRSICVHMDIVLGKSDVVDIMGARVSLQQVVCILSLHCGGSVMPDQTIVTTVKFNTVE